MSDWLTLPRMLLSLSNTETLIGPPFGLLVYTDRSESQWWNQLRLMFDSLFVFVSL